MNERHFHLRLQASYKSEENEIDELAVEVLHEDAWEALDLTLRTPGFLMYINALFSCQHLYLRANCAERDLRLSSAEGELKVVASENWELRDIAVRFHGKLISGTLTDEAMSYISGRMNHCPVSTNLPANVPLNIAVKLDPPQS